MSRHLLETYSSAGSIHSYAEFQQTILKMRSYTDNLLAISPELWADIGEHKQQDMLRSMLGLNGLTQSLLHRYYNW
jgi:hypothetical protein